MRERSVTFYLNGPTDGDDSKLTFVLLCFATPPPQTQNDDSYFWFAFQRPNDKELPRFDPKQFKPGCPPPIVKKGDEEYHLIVTGVKDTGLCGKYWGESDALPSKRKRVSIAQVTYVMYGLITSLWTH